MDVLSLRGILTLDKSEYDKGLTEADTQAKGFGSKMSKAMKVGTVAVAALGAGTVLLSKKLVDGAKSVAEYGDHVDKMSQKIGISTDAYQKWDYVMKRAGGNVDSLKMGMKTLSQQAEKNSDAFQALGISEEQVANLSKEDLFTETVKGLSEMEDSTERTALATKLLGRAGADLAPLFNQGSEAIEEQMEIAEKYGMVMPEEAVKASAAFEDSMTTLQMTTEGLKNRLLGEFLPSMTKVTDGMALLFTGDMSGLDDVTEGIKEFIGKIGEMAPKVLEAGGKLISGLVKGMVQKIPTLLSSAGDMIMKLFGSIEEKLPDIQTTISNTITKIGEWLQTNGPTLLQNAATLGLKLVEMIAKAIIEAVPVIISSIPALIKGIVKGFKDYDWSKTGKTIIKGIAKGIRAVGKMLKTAISKPVKDAKDAIVTGFQNAKDKAVEYMQKLKDKISEKITDAKDKVKEIVDKIKAFFPIDVGKIFKGWIPKISIRTKTSDKGASTDSSVGRERFARAMNQPYVFKNPTEFYAGDAGDEVLFGRNSLMQDIEKAASKGGDIIINLTYNAGDDAEEMVRDIARGVKRYRMAGAF